MVVRPSVAGAGALSLECDHERGVSSAASRQARAAASAARAARDAPVYDGLYHGLCMFERCVPHYFIQRASYAYIFISLKYIDKKKLEQKLTIFLQCYIAVSKATVCLNQS